MNYSVKNIVRSGRSVVDHIECPFHDAAASICSASLTAMSTERIRALYCGNDDYDNCPLFLSKVLRQR